jgi:hypothetical protein
MEETTTSGFVVESVLLTDSIQKARQKTAYILNAYE